MSTQLNYNCQINTANLSNATLALMNASPGCTNKTSLPKEIPWDEEQYVFLFISILIITNNAALIGVIIMNRSLRKATNTIICSMSIAAMLFATLYLIPRFVRKDSRFSNVVFCTLLPQFFVFLDLTICFHLCLISYEKYYAILYPFHYRAKATLKFAFIAIAIVWSIALFVAAIPYFTHRFFLPNICIVINIHQKNDEYAYYVAVYCILFFFPLISMLIAYSHIFVIAHRHSRKLDSNIEGTSYFAVLKNVKAARYMAIVVGVFTIMALPYHIFFFIHKFEVRTRVTSTLKIVRYIYFSYPCINPVMYGYFNPQVRQKFIKFVLNRRNTQSSIEIRPRSTSFNRPSSSSCLPSCVPKNANSEA